MLLKSGSGSHLPSFLTSASSHPLKCLPTIKTCNPPINLFQPGSLSRSSCPCTPHISINLQLSFPPPSPTSHHRLPSAYRLLLAECVRRCGWSELYTGQAARLAEHMARVREKEVGRRELFHAQVERYLPQEVLQGAGLAEDPPRCGISLPQPSVPLLVVTVQVSFRSLGCLWGGLNTNQCLSYR